MLLAGHLAIALARIPSDVVGKRGARIAEFHARGAVRFHLDTKWMQGADAVETVLRHSAPHAVVLYRGPHTGALEFVPPLLWPRLLCAEGWADSNEQETRARLLARVPDGARDGVAVLVCEPETRGSVQHLRLVTR